MTKKGHAFVAKKAFRAGQLVLPPFVHSLLSPAKSVKAKKTTESKCFSLEVGVGAVTKEYCFKEPEETCCMLQTETGEQLVCYPFWRAFHHHGKKPPHQTMILRRGVISVPMQNFSTKDAALKIQNHCKVGNLLKQQKTNALTMNIPYLVNDSDVKKGDVLFAGE